LLAAIGPQLESHTTVLVKGSRSAAMEQVVRGLSERGS
jgi:UDP-N-acetylmuramyl pentapeptide synthase